MTKFKGANKFAVGDRVAVYEYVHEYGENHPGHAKRSIWKINAFKGGLVFCAKEDSLNLSWFHIKQLRRLKSKPKAESKPPREWTGIWQYDDGGFVGFFPECKETERSEIANQGKMTLTELPPRSAVVTRESLAAKWDIIAKAESLASADNSYAFNAFCKALNLPSPKDKE